MSVKSKIREQLIKALEAGLDASEGFSGLIEVAGEAPACCPICNGAFTEISQSDSNVAFEEFFKGCEHCDIWWYTHEEPIV